MKVKIWGCRGSLPSPGPENLRYGGNTSCIQVIQEDTQVILDAGSGIVRLGKFLSPEIKEVHIFLTHLHIDHTLGLGFFLPLYNPKVKVHIYGPCISSDPLLKRLRRYFSPPLFPVKLSELPVHPEIHELGGDTVRIGDIEIKSDYVCHPGATLGYRITAGGSVFTYIPDHELQLGSAGFPHYPEWTSGFDLADRADLLFHDGSYTAKEYPAKMGWGHSSVRDAIAFGKICKVKRLGIFHHEPMRTDEMLEDMLEISLRVQKPKFPVEMCAEGMVYQL
jgi:phosphoribosyl 1,2-cyclic phosphodiesterase